MASAIVTIDAFVARDSEIKFTQSGESVVEFSLPVTPQRRTPAGEWEDTGPTVWYRCSIWGRPGEDAAELLVKGQRVKATGGLTIREYEHNGEKRTSNDVRVDQIGFFRPRDGWPQGGRRPSAAQADPWQGGDTADGAPF